MSERWFVFVQLEVPWELGPADGRYLLRDAGGEPAQVVVLGTLASAPSAPRRGRGRGRIGRAVDPQPPPAMTGLTRATVIDPVSVPASAQAQAWLQGLDVEHALERTAAVLNGVLQAHRIATSDPYVREVSPAQAVAARAGWGAGEQVADGHWEHARELIAPGRGRRRARVFETKRQERLAWLLGGHETALVCEELALRARRDFDAGRLALAALELRSAYAAALGEIDIEARPDLAVRLAELRELSATIPVSDEVPDAETLGHALGRLEALLRARAVALKLQS